MATGFNTDQSHAGILDKVVKGTDGVGATTDTGNDSIRQLAHFFVHLGLDFSTNNPLEVTDNGGERVGTDGGANEVMRSVHSSDPISQSLVDSVLQGLGTRRDGNNTATEHLDPENVQLLPPHILGTHENITLHAKLGADGGGRDTVLTGTRLGDNSSLTQSLGEENLADGIVNLVRTSVVEIFPLEPDPGTAHLLGQPLGKVKFARSIDVTKHILKLFPERRVLLGLGIGSFKLVQTVNKRFSDIGTTEKTESRRKFTGAGDLDFGLVKGCARGNGEGRGDGTSIGRRRGSSILSAKRGRVLALESNFSAIVFDDLGGKTVIGVLKDELDDFGSNDNGISTGSCNIVKVGTVVNTKTDSERDGGEHLDTLDEFREGS